MPATLPDVLAKVNGEPVERWELEVALKRTEARNGGQVPPDKRDEVLRGILDQLVAFHMLDQSARLQKLVVSDADVDAQMATFRKNFPTDYAWGFDFAPEFLARIIDTQVEHFASIDRSKPTPAKSEP